MLQGRLRWLWLRLGLQANRGLSLWLHGGIHGSALRLGIQSDNVNPRLGIGKCCMIEGRRDRFRNVLDEIRGVHYEHSGCRG